MGTTFLAVTSSSVMLVGPPTSSRPKYIIINTQQLIYTIMQNSITSTEAPTERRNSTTSSLPVVEQKCNANPSWNLHMILYTTCRSTHHKYASRVTRVSMYIYMYSHCILQHCMCILYMYNSHLSLMFASNRHLSGMLHVHQLYQDQGPIHMYLAMNGAHESIISA